MNREQEHYILKQELTSTPPELEDVLARAQERANKRKTVRNCLVMPLGTIAAMFILFVGMVNLSPAMASAMAQIPGLRQLTIAVSFSPSLTEAVEQDLVQTMGLEQTIGDVTMRIEYLVVDNQQLHIFYTLDSPTFSWLDANIGVSDAEADEDGWEEETGYLISSWGIEYRIPQLIYEPGVLRHLVVGGATPVPPVIYVRGFLQGRVSSDAPCGMCCEGIGRFSFTLELDSALVGQGELITLDYDFVLDGQHLALSTVELNPIQTRVSFAADEENTAWLWALGFYLENESGQRFDSSAIAKNLRTDGRTMMRDTHFLESAFFAESESLTMFIEEVTWIDKVMEHVRIDLVNGTADALPEGVEFIGAEQRDMGWILTFELSGEGGYQIIFEENLTSGGVWEIVCDDMSDRLFYHGLPLARYDETVLYLTLQSSRTVRLETPLEIRVM